jgi:hypothetical protein
MQKTRRNESAFFKGIPPNSCILLSVDHALFYYIIPLPESQNKAEELGDRDLPPVFRPAAGRAAAPSPD